MIETIGVQLKINFWHTRAVTICKFSGYCKYYQRDAYTCNDDEAESYCGIRREFDEFVPLSKKKKKEQVEEGTSTAESV